MPKLIEIRTYQLKPGTGGQFHQLVAEKSAPLHADWGMDVVAFGQSLSDPDTYVLIRAYADLAHLASSQSAFYASDAWRNGPRQAIVSLILSDSNAVLRLDQASIDQLRKARGLTPFS
jgi:quinol monooxygenase YgiN